MKLRKSALMTIVAAAIGLGAAGQSVAGVYAGSASDFDNLSVTISPFAGATVNNFDFASTNTAQFDNGTIATSGGTCGTTASGNDCGILGTTSVLAGDVLSFGAANAVGGDAAATRATSDYTTLFGPGTLQYANSNSRIEDATLTEGIPTSTQQIAEAEIQNATSANANAEISSLTSFTFTFTTVASGSMTIAFDASKYLLADVNDATADTASARASIETQFTLRQSGGSQFWQWSPGDQCLEAGGISGCVGQVAGDAYNLGNDSVLASAVPTDNDPAIQGSQSFSATANNLLAGTYTLTLFSKSSVVVRRSQVEAVPEPSILLLLGAGLAGIGITRRKQRS